MEAILVNQVALGYHDAMQDLTEGWIDRQQWTIVGTVLAAKSQAGDNGADYWQGYIQCLSDAGMRYN